MTNDSIEDQIISLIADALDWTPPTVGAFGSKLPLDISRPNMHDSKAEFDREYEAVEGVLDRLYQSLLTLVGDPDDDEPELDEMRANLADAIDGIAIAQSSRARPGNVRQLIVRNCVDTGFFDSSIDVVIDMARYFQFRRDELDEQRNQYWSVPHRPPNYYARAIALRFARFYARHMQVLPTFGTASDGGHPSTKYAQILEQIFAILDISAGIRRHAEWAIGQLTEEDIKPPRSSIFDPFFSIPSPSSPPPPRPTGLGALGGALGVDLSKAPPKGSNK